MTTSGSSPDGEPVRVAALTGREDGRRVDEAWSMTSRQLRAFIARRVEDPATAEDITQEVLIRVYRSRSGLADIGSVPAWLHRIARNAIIDHYRTRRSSVPLPADDVLELSFHRQGDDAEPNAATRELAQCLRPLIDQLPDKYREAITLVDLDGHTQVAAAHTLGLSLSGAKSRVQRGRRQLRQLLTDCCAVATNHTGAVTGYIAHTGGDCDCSGHRSTSR